jgi:hypothetical protein
MFERDVRVVSSARAETVTYWRGGAEPNDQKVTIHGRSPVIGQSGPGPGTTEKTFNVIAPQPGKPTFSS